MNSINVSWVPSPCTGNKRAREHQTYQDNLTVGQSRSDTGDSGRAIDDYISRPRVKHMLDDSPLLTPDTI
jgi:hypothetical protein